MAVMDLEEELTNSLLDENGLPRTQTRRTTPTGGTATGTAVPRELPDTTSPVPAGEGQGTPAPQTPDATPAATTFNLGGSRVHGRAADTNDFVDLMSVAMQQSGYDVSTPQAADATFNNIIKPLMAQQGLNVTRSGTHGDKITANGKTLDFIGNSSAPGQRTAIALQGSDRSSVSGSGNPISNILNRGGQSGGAYESGGIAGGGSVSLEGDHVATSVGGGDIASREAALGIQDRGNNMVYIPSYGGMVDRNHPVYQQAMAAGGGAGAGGGASGPATDLESMLARLVAQQEADRARNQEFSDRIHGTINDQIAEGSKPVDENAPSITQPMRAFSGQQDRAMAAGREALAARAGREGLPTGAFDASIQSSYENMGTDKGAYNASLIVDELKAKRQQLQHAMDTGAGLLTAEEARNLQSQLATVTARIQKLDLDQSGAIANRELDVRSDLGRGQLDLGRYAEDNQNNRFYDALGLDIGSREAALNEALMRQLAGKG